MNHLCSSEYQCSCVTTGSKGGIVYTAEEDTITGPSGSGCGGL
jgi:hypothetical protein